MFKANKQVIFIGVIFLVLGIILGVLFERAYLPNPASELSVTREGGYNYINPLLSCDFSENKQFSEYEPIETKFQAYIKQHIANGDAQDISVYFRGLNSGYWSGVNENDTYSPASLLKLPIMIAWLRKADSDPSVLAQQITYHQTTDQNALETYKPSHFITDGNTYTVDDLIRYMIMYSDNNAAQLLEDNIDNSSLIEVYTDLGLPIASDNTEQSISPKQYSYIFRILYNATYLSKSNSEYALQLLSAADFPAGIKAGLPASIPSSQKFGERTVLTKDDLTGADVLDYRELHDCGIIYYPNNPYLLCIMTKGTDFTKLSGIISDLSKMVYQETNSGVLKI